MQLNKLSPRNKSKKNPPVGRGGRRGKTSGRGHKGQSSRAGHKIRPEIRDLIKKLPKLRGHGKNRSRTVRTNRTSVAPVNLSTLDTIYKSGETISPATLLEKGLVRSVKGRAPAVKILGVLPSGGLKKAFIIKQCTISTTAREAVLAAGGQVS